MTVVLSIQCAEEHRYCYSAATVLPRYFEGNYAKEGRTRSGDGTGTERAASGRQAGKIRVVSGQRAVTKRVTSRNIIQFLRVCKLNCVKFNYTISKKKRCQLNISQFLTQK